MCLAPRNKIRYRRDNTETTNCVREIHVQWLTRQDQTVSRVFMIPLDEKTTLDPTFPLTENAESSLVSGECSWVSQILWV